jgi:ArsR family transcriptional regulator, virulence genes transcriptional regulator
MTRFHDMAADAGRACDFLKALTNPNRLIILCLLAEGEKSVSELEALLRLRQPTLSQQLARLRAEQLVETRRAGKMIYYRLASSEARQVIELLYELFCAPGAAAEAGRVEAAGAALPHPDGMPDHI